MPKPKTAKKVLAIKGVPLAKKDKKKEKEHPGIIKKKKVNRHFLISAEANEALKYLVQYAEKKLSFQINDTSAIQILIRGAAKNPDQFIEWVKL